ncbi:hypothetical protein K8B33_14040 [Alcanivorax sp. JB21]|uniref:hypothetical protein n=1 Tax=Alcanivorax limicola TaxID=2874102 RepID=UPI001CBE7234|nr:hypothetical protein [Alcanivorax limicola]MBZ2190226.1 hypothetical protein [Alcanivorax limicola]
MKRPPVLLHMLFASLLLSPLSHGSDCDERIPLPERPLLESYTDYSAFIVDIMNFKRIEERHIRHRAQCPSLYGSRHDAAYEATAGTREYRPSATLGDALAEASRRPPFDYQRHTTWYDRSTSRSFALAGLSGNELATQRLRVGNADTPLQLPASTYVALPEDWRGDDLERVVARLREGRQQDELVALYDEVSGTSLPLASVVVRGNLILYLDLDNQLLRTEGTVYGCMACAPGS